MEGGTGPEREMPSREVIVCIQRRELSGGCSMQIPILQPPLCWRIRGEMRRPWVEVELRRWGDWVCASMQGTKLGDSCK